MPGREGEDVERATAMGVEGDAQELEADDTYFDPLGYIEPAQ